MNDPSSALARSFRSFRDPAGRVFFGDNVVYRAVFAEGLPCWEAYAQSPALQKARAAGRLIAYEPTDLAQAEQRGITGVNGEAPVRLVQHKKVAFPNYPHEWAAPMLAAAGKLTLDLAREVLNEGLRLKDASPFNVMFESAAPVFLDALSFEPRPPESALWLAEAQFLRAVYYPLLLWQGAKIPLASTFLADREGATSEQAVSVLGPLARLIPRHLLFVTLPALMDRRARASWTQKGVAAAQEQKRTPEQSLAILGALFDRLGGLLTAAQREQTTSHWSLYGTRQHYADEATLAKRAFVAQGLERAKPRRTLDIGCNLGEFTTLAAKHGTVVAIDSDPEVVGALWRESYEKKLPVLPLVQNIAAPSPALGWMYGETLSFLDRARGAFDMVMMLAVLHHLLVTQRLPLEEIVDLAATLTTGHLIIEYVDPKDPMFRTIARGRDALHAGLTEASFERALGLQFEILEKAPLPGLARTLYLARKKP